MSALVSFDTVIPDIETETPWCPVPVIELKLRAAITELCENANVWREMLADIPLVVGQTDYRIEPPVGTLVHSMLGVYRGSTWLRPNDFRVMDPGNVSLVSTPRRTDTTIRPYVTLKPDHDSLVFSKSLLDNHRRTIIIGALSELLKMREQKWTAMRMAKDYRNQFEIGMADARRAITQDFSTAAHTASPANFDTTRRVGGYFQDNF